jgi:hypothetical protein
MRDLRDVLRPVRDQGDRETCLSMALSDGHQACVDAAPCLSADFLHFHAAVAAGVSVNDAVSVSAAMLALESDGQPAETECPYSPRPRADGWKPAPPVGGVWRHTTGAKQDDIWGIIVKCVGDGKPVVLVLKVDDSFFNPVAGVVETSQDPPRASHAVLAVAHEAKPGRVLVRNSWGTQWGDEGYAWLSSAYVAARCTGIVTFEGAIS